MWYLLRRVLKNRPVALVFSCDRVYWISSLSPTFGKWDLSQRRFVDGGVFLEDFPGKFLGHSKRCVTLLRSLDHTSAISEIHFPSLSQTVAALCPAATRFQQRCCLYIAAFINVGFPSKLLLAVLSALGSSGTFSGGRRRK